MTRPLAHYIIYLKSFICLKNLNCLKCFNCFKPIQFLSILIISLLPFAAAAEGPRLYILNCGTIDPMNPELFGLKAEEIVGDASFVSPCYLVVHPRGTLVWDVGQVPDQKIPDDGTEVSEQEILKATQRLSSQLQALNHEIKDISYMAMSHYHADHTANANMFVNSTWIVQQAEYDVMFGGQDVGILTPDSYKDLKFSKRLMLPGTDHDVFGDGKVIIKFAPGHTPGHQMLFLDLENFGPLLLSGDLWHLPEERTLDRVPTFDADGDLTRESRKKIEAFLQETKAAMWIQHDPPTYAKLKKAPLYYD